MLTAMPTAERTTIPITQAKIVMEACLIASSYWRASSRLVDTSDLDFCMLDLVSCMMSVMLPTPELISDLSLSPEKVKFTLGILKFFMLSEAWPMARLYATHLGQLADRPLGNAMNLSATDRVPATRESLFARTLAIGVWIAPIAASTATTADSVVTLIDVSMPLTYSTIESRKPLAECCTVSTSSVTEVPASRPKAAKIIIMKARTKKHPAQKTTPHSG
mmetsp:Transcript_17388/g.40905  ORF Transcript_17388/g.40905 Transcript_17388/m.40905 type:complete len:220 (-) Transcript_17388:527-1186(-)